MTTIAVTGKGGVGKTTISALTIHWLARQKKGPVLAVDADSNSNLHELLGIEYTSTVGGVREEARKRISSMGAGIAKQQFLEMQIAQSLVERQGYDLLVMGRPEGPGCYCFANSILRDAIQRLSRNYRFLVVDCEAGLEHLSRRTVLEVDYLLTVSDPSLRGLRTANRVSRILDEMDARIRRRGLIVNQVRGSALEFSAPQLSVIAEGGFEEIVALPYDETIRLLDEEGGSINENSAEGALKNALDVFLAHLFDASLT
jgi:CO dehydrogenase maturation factor